MGLPQGRAQAPLASYNIVGKGKAGSEGHAQFAAGSLPFIENRSHRVTLYFHLPVYYGAFSGANQQKSRLATSPSAGGPYGGAIALTLWPSLTPPPQPAAATLTEDIAPYPAATSNMAPSP